MNRPGQWVWTAVRQCFGVVSGILLVAAAARGQNSQILFDSAGNFLMQTSETIASPQILRQPQMQVVQPRKLAAFSVLALDTSGLSYQWLFNGAIILGANSDTLVISNVATNNQGYFSVVLSNGSGSVTSSPAPLWIDSRGSGMPDWWQLAYFGNLGQNATADNDGDGVSNLQEFLDGTNPTNSASVAYRLTLFSDGGVVQVVPNQGSYSPSDVVTLTATALAPETFHAWTGDIVSQSNTVSLIMSTNKTVFARFTPIDFFWTNATGGDWSVTTNWNPNLVPLTNDNVYFSLGGPTVTQSNAAECLCLFLGVNGGVPNLVLGSTLTVHGPSFWGAGQLSGTGRLIVDTPASLAITNPGVLGLGVGLNASSIENGGTILLTGAGSLGGNGGFITNRLGALFELQGAGTLANFAGSYRFDNSGVFRKSLNPGTNLISIPFNNYGTVYVATGTLACASAFTNTGTVTLAPAATNRLTVGGFSSGAFNVPPTALVEWTGGTFLNSGGQLNGGGVYRINANGGGLVANTDLSVSNLDLLLGALDGSGMVTINNLMNWTGGSMTGSGRTFIPPGASLNLANPNNVNLSRTVENGGTVLWTGAGTFSLSGGIITNRAGALFEQDGAGSFANFNSPYEFDNSGIFRKTIDPGTNSATVTFNNYGTIDIESGTVTWTRTLTNYGTLILAPGTTNRFSVSTALSSGPFSAPPGALVELNSGTLTLVPGAQLSGGGLYRLDGGVLLANTDLSVSNLDYVNNAGGAAFDGSGTVTINGLMNWTTGTMSGSGRTFIAPGATLNVANPNNVNLSRTLENGGTIVWTGAGNFTLSSGIITNRPGALFDAQNAASFAFFASPYRFDNAGTFRKSLSSGTLSVGIPFTNYGTVDLRLGVLAANNGYASFSNALLNCALAGTSAGTNYGQLQVAGSVTLDGTLTVVLTNGFTPSTNSTFTVLTAGTRNGTFANFYYPSNAVTMQLSNTPSSVIVQVTGVVIPPPLLLSPTISGSNVLLTWTAIPNATYRLEFNPNLAPSNWTALPGDVTSVSNFAAKSDLLTSSNRLYRVHVVP